jgi:glycosyltransferase involved in cell wall biosynthesis
MFEHLLQEKGFDKVIYLDPDIYVYRPLQEVESLLENKANIVLTPHLTGDLDDDNKPDELDILRTGSYNLGFLALRNDPEVLKFLHWWMNKLEEYCVVDLANGLFVDQKWIDLVPGKYRKVFILQHHGYNVAYWNLLHRKVSKNSQGLCINDHPLIFFHFSGLNPEDPTPFSKHQNRYTLHDLGLLQEIVRAYCEALQQNGYLQYRQLEYSYARMSDGTWIPDILRGLYRKSPLLQKKAGDHPFDYDFASALEDKALQKELVATASVPLLAHEVWKCREDLQRAFPDIHGADRQRFIEWFSNVGCYEHHIPEGLAKRGNQNCRETEQAPELHPEHKFISEATIEKASELISQYVSGLIARQETPEVSKERLSKERHGFCGGHYFGFYDQEKQEDLPGYVWMGAEAWVRIPDCKPGWLEIQGAYDGRSIVKACGAKENSVLVSINDQPVQRIALVKSGVFTSRIEVSGIDDSDAAVLRLQPEHVFQPCSISPGEDDRTLSLRINKVIFNGQVLLDFGHEQSYYLPDIRHKRNLGMNIIGYARSEHGLGESPRRSAQIAEAAGIDYHIFDFNRGNRSRTRDTRYEHRIVEAEDCNHPVNLLHINADQMQLVHSALGETLLHQGYNIGYWAWELPDFPDRYMSNFYGLDEVWVPSSFIQQAVSLKSPVPVIRMPHCVAFEPREELTREALGINPEAFIFLCMFDFDSIYERKNPEAAIEAFKRLQQNSSGPKVQLLIKTQNSEHTPDKKRRLLQRIGKDRDIILVDETYSRDKVYALEMLCDCLVSLHRSEGFGLILAECMYLGKPVVATNWSGNTDFMTQQNSCPVNYDLVTLRQDYGPYTKGNIWAEPDIEHAAWHMQRLVQDQNLRQALAEQARETILRYFSPQAVAMMYRKRLELIF